MKLEDRSPSEPWFLRHWPALLGVALGALVCLRTVTAFTDQPWFDVDPVFDPNPYAGLGPAGSLRIDAAICVVSGLMLLAFAGRAAALLALGALSVVTLSDARLPEYIVQMLDSVQLVNSVEDGHKLGRQTSITPDGYRQDTRGGIFVGVTDLYCGASAGGQSPPQASSSTTTTRLL